MTARPAGTTLWALTQRVGALTPAVAEAAAAVRRAAVAAVLRPDGGGSAELLFIERAVYPGDPWSGQVAFPGGRAEADDPTLRHTAVRETREELGSDLEQLASFVGTLDEIHPLTTLLPPIVVRPHVFVLHADFPTTPSDEVAAAFWVPLGVLLEPATRGRREVEARGARFTMPAFTVGERVIWGMTERILSQLLGLPLPPW